MPEGSRVVVLDPGFKLDAVKEALVPLGFEVEFSDGVPSGSGIVGILACTDIPVVGSDLAAMPDLKAVATPSVGLDHIPLGEAAELGIWVSNVPDFCTSEVADTTIGLILALRRGIAQLDRSVRSGEWNWEAAGELRRLEGSTLGLVGFGRIGQAVARRAAAFGLEIWASDPGLLPADIANAGARPCSFEDLIAGCAVISLHAPMRPEDGPLISATELRAMRSDAILVNASRGGLVDLSALLAALESGEIAGAGLDVLPEEPPAGGAPRHDRLLITPHAAWFSREAEEAAFREPIAAMAAVLSGSRPAPEVTVVEGSAAVSS